MFGKLKLNIDKKLTLIILLALILRLIRIDQSLWHDEAITALAARDYNIKEILGNFILYDNHTPLYYILLRVWGLVFGFSDINLRGFSITIGVLTIYFFYKLVLIVEKNVNTARMAALLFSVFAFHVYYSQEIRMYVLTCLLTVMSSLFFLQIEDKKNTRFTKQHLYFGLTIALLMMSDYVPVFFLPIFWVYAILKQKTKNWWKLFILSHLPLLIFSLIWIPVFSHQIDNYKEVLQNLPLWKGVVGGGSIRQLIIFWMKLILGRISTTKPFYYLLIVIFSIPYLISLKRSIKKANLYFMLWFITPLILGLSVSIIFPAFNYFRFLYVVPAFIFLIVNGSAGSKMGTLFFNLIIVINLIGLTIYYFDDRQLREDWKDATTIIETKAKNDNSAIIFNYYSVPAGYRWYSRGYSNTYSLKDSDALIGILDQHRSIYYFDYLQDIYDPASENIGTIRNIYQEIDIFDFRGVGQVRYYIRP